MFGFLVELRKMMKEIMGIVEAKGLHRKAWDLFCKCVMINFKNEIFIIAP